MNIHAIQAFVKTVEQGSFAAVARVARVAPSSISRLVAELEDELQVRLFQRTTRRLNLTEAGRAYLERVSPLLEELERARDHARDIGSAPRGTLRVACSGTFLQLHLSCWLAPFLAQYPDLDIEFVLESAYTDLVSNRIDVALRLGHVEGASLVFKKLCEMPRVLVASPGFIAGRQLTLKDIAEGPCLLFPHEGFAPVWRFRDRRARVRELRPKSRLIAADGVVLRDLAVKGVGVALLARWLCARELASGALVELLPCYEATATEFDAGVFLVYPSRSYIPLKVRLFVDFISGMFQNGSPWEQSPGR